MYAARFSRPEIQLQINNISNSVTNNTLVITAEVADTMVKRHKEIHSKVERLFESRRPKGVSGGGNGAKSPKDREPEMEVEATVIPAEITLPEIGLPPDLNFVVTLFPGQSHHALRNAFRGSSQTVGGICGRSEYSRENRRRRQSR